jgi:glycosyltransferase involved in cell wall biosynthesis
VTVVAVNGRYVTQPLTGVQRVSHELVRHLADAVDGRVLLLIPPDRVIELVPGEEPPVAVLDERWWGLRGHRWEQTTLRTMTERVGADVLFSPAGWGPLLHRRQVPLFHDLHPMLLPEHFAPNFVRLAKLAMPTLVRASPRVVVISSTVRRQVLDRWAIPRSRVALVPGGVGSPFVDRSLDDLDRRPGDFCLLVSGDKSQKNLAFLLGFWEAVHRELGLRLVVTERPVGSRVGATVVDPPGVERRLSPNDDELGDLLADALCVVSPSLAEGYNLPLLEGMASGTPFLATDTGAARELAEVGGGEVLPLEPDRWIEALRRWRQDPGGQVARRQRAARAGRRMTWAASAQGLSEVLEAVARSPRSRGRRAPWPSGSSC